MWQHCWRASLPFLRALRRRSNMQHGYCSLNRQRRFCNAWGARDEKRSCEVRLSFKSRRSFGEFAFLHLAQICWFAVQPTLVHFVGYDSPTVHGIGLYKRPFGQIFSQPQNVKKVNEIQSNVSLENEKNYVHKFRERGGTLCGVFLLKRSFTRRAACLR